MSLLKIEFVWSLKIVRVNRFLKVNCHWLSGFDEFLPNVLYKLSLVIIDFHMYFSFQTYLSIT